MLQIDDLNALVGKRQREAARLRAQVEGLLAKPAASASLPQLAVQASLAAALRQQNAALASENEALRHTSGAHGGAGSGEGVVLDRSSADTSANGGTRDDGKDKHRLELLAAAVAFKAEQERLSAALVARSERVRALEAQVAQQGTPLPDAALAGWDGAASGEGTGVVRRVREGAGAM